MKRGQQAGRQGREARQGQKLEPLGWPLVRLALVLVLGAIAPLLDTTVASVALHTLADQFHVGVSSVQWVTTGYLLALAMVIPVSGWATERFGDKRVWIGSLLLFTAGSVLSGQARDFASLVAFRALQGAAAGLITPVVQTMLVRAAGREKLGRVITIVTIVSLFPPIAGPVIAGLILAHASWRWIFYVNVPVCAAAIILAWVFVPRPEPRPQGQAPADWTSPASSCSARPWSPSSTGCRRRRPETGSPAPAPSSRSPPGPCSRPATSATAFGAPAGH
jgi:MFS family permease